MTLPSLVQLVMCGDVCGEQNKREGERREGKTGEGKEEEGHGGSYP